jgi:NADH:ubiquinone reductase (H+-translocating)
MAPDPATADTLVLGAGYAGLSVWHEIHRRARGRWPVRLIDRHPNHVVRTELYKVGRIAENESAAPWALPLRDLLDHEPGSLVTGQIASIDLQSRLVHLEGGSSLPYEDLVIALGSVAAYYGVAGAPEHTFSIYRLTEAQRLARAIREAQSRRRGTTDPLRVSVVGGGSTGTELAAEIATTNWSKLVGGEAPAPAVTLVVGALPFLAGFPERVIVRARRELTKAGVRMDENRNVQTVSEGALTLADGGTIPFDLCVWAAGVQAPSVVRAIDAPHGRSGRIRVEPTLEIPGHPGAFAIGDVIDLEDPVRHVPVPATAQAALAEAPVAARNLVARRMGQPMRAFRYRERGVIVQLGLHDAAGAIDGLSIWGRPASFLKSAVQEGHRMRARSGGRPPGL